MLLNPNYKVRNLLVLNLAAFACISLVVFVSASLPFYLSEVAGILPEKTGAAIGTLGALDELVAIIVAPLLGTLNDRINGWAWDHPKIPAGSRVLELCSFLLVGTSLVGFGKFSSQLFPDLWLWRAVFAAGVCGCMSIVTVMLHEANNSDFRWAELVFWRVKVPVESGALLHDTDAETGSLPPGNDAPRRRAGAMAALLGVSAGLGAVFAVLCYLPLPVQLGAHYPEMLSRDALKVTYTGLGVVAFVAGVFVSVFAYDCVKQRRKARFEPELEHPHASYAQLLKMGIDASRRHRPLQLAYVGLFVARSTNVLVALFIPLMVYKFYYSNNKCTGSVFGEGPDRTNCYDGYVFLAILTGVAQTVALVSSPAWGFLVDSPRAGARLLLVAAAILGAVGCFGLCVVGAGSGPYDPRNALCFVLVCFIGLAQIGTVIASMSLLSGVGQTAERAEHRVVGAISGLYSLCGGVGILAITVLGGAWSDRWVFGPFFLLGVFNVVLLGVGHSHRRE